MEVKYLCKGPRTTDGRRVRCGHDLTALVLAVPGDGKDYEVPCPACGNKSSVKRTPPAPGKVPQP